MSNMLEQAIADAAALREQAIRNAEQSVIDKYSRQIKEAVDKMLESDSPMDRVDNTINEVEEELKEDMESAPSPALNGYEQGATVEAPPAWDSRYDDIMTKFSAMIDNLPADTNGMIDLDLGDFEMTDEEKSAMGGDEEAGTSMGATDMVSEPTETAPEGEDTDSGGDDLDSLLGSLEEALRKDNKKKKEVIMSEEDEELKEIMNMLDEAMEIDYDPIIAEKGQWMNSPSEKQRNMDMAQLLYGDEDSSEEDSESDEESSEDMGAINELHETVENLTQRNKQMEGVLSKLEIHLEESLLSNAKLLYQNRTLSDASLNERQKSKIVEAIANAESPKEAKNLFETLKATVGSTPSQKKGPQSLSESVNRRSNLSSMLNSRQNINESKQADDPFLEKMQKLAGIKK